MSRTRWLALAGVGALGALAVLIPGGAGASFSNSTKYEGVVNGSQANAAVTVVYSSGSCVLASSQKAWVVSASGGSPSTAGADSISITLKNSSGGTISTTSVTAFSSNGGATNSGSFAAGTAAPCGGTGSVTFQPIKNGNAAGAADSVSVTFNVTYQ